MIKGYIHNFQTIKSILNLETGVLSMIKDQRNFQTIKSILNLLKQHGPQIELIKQNFQTIKSILNSV